MLEVLQRVHGAIDKQIATDGTTFSSEIDQSSDTPMLKVIREDREEFPIMITASVSQILCNTVLFDEQQISDDHRNEVNEIMLQLNMAMPLSSFGKIGPYYSVFGAMATETLDKNILLEIETLSDNVIDALDVMENYLQ